jgi:hypothetical protein
VTNMTPSEAMFKFKPKTHLSLLKPHLVNEMEAKQQAITQSADAHRGKPRIFKLNDRVYVRTVRQEKVNWQSGIVTKVISPVTYLVQVEGRTRFVHIDHLRANHAIEDEEDITLQFPREIYQSPKVVTPAESPRPNTPIKRQSFSPPGDSPKLSPKKAAATEPKLTEEEPTLRRSQRSRRVPQKLGL